MKTLILPDKKINIRASNLALIYYQQEFKSCLLTDLARYVQENNNLSEDEIQIDTVFMLKMAWAMHKADKRGSLVDFITWAEETNIDFGDERFYTDILQEAQNFLITEKPGNNKGNKSRSKKKRMK